MALKLTPAQERFMGTFDLSEDLRLETSWGCGPEELGVARNCAEKGLLSIKGHPERGDHFEIVLTSLGMSVAKCLLEKRSSEVAA
jgi:hypothetical protein